MAKAKQDVAHSFDKTTVAELLDIFSDDRKSLLQYLKLKNEKDALWRVKTYNSYEIRLEKKKFEKAREEAVHRLSVEKQQKELRFLDEWSHWEIVQALREYLVSEDVMDETEDVYHLRFENQYDDLFNFEYGIYEGKIQEWSICEEKHVEDIAKQYLQSSIESCGGVLNAFNKEFVMNYIDGDKMADDMEYDERYMVEENVESYLSKEDRELSSEQEEKILEFEDKIKELREEQDELDLDLPEAEQRYDEIEDEISDIEQEIDDIRDDPEGDWNQEKIEEIVNERLNEIRDDPVGWAKGLGLEDDFLERYIDEDELIEAAIEADGYGHHISSYDGQTREHTYNGTLYYIFRKQ